MSTARFASPEGWQVSVRFSLIGVDRGVLFNRGRDTGPLAQRESAGGRVAGVISCGGPWDRCRRGEQC